MPAAVFTRFCRALRPAAAAACLLLATACAEPGDDAPAGAMEVRVVSLAAPGTPWHDAWLRFQQRVEAVPGSGIDLKMFITGQVGSEETALSNLRRGRVQVGGFSLHGLASVVPELSVLLAPYLFDSREQVDYVLDNYLTDIFTELFDAQGLALLSWSEVGWNHVFCRKPVVTPADIRGVRIRASSSAGPQIFARAVGADTIPVPFSEMLTALQTGLIDCGQGGIGLYALAGVAAEAPYLTLTHHLFDTGLVLANRDWLAGIDARRRDIITGSVDRAPEARRLLREEIARLLDGELARMGVTVIELDAEQLKAWRAAVGDTHKALVAEVGGRAGDVYALINEGKAAFAAAQ